MAELEGNLLGTKKQCILAMVYSTPNVLHKAKIQLARHVLMNIVL